LVSRRNSARAKCALPHDALLYDDWAKTSFVSLLEDALYLALKRWTIHGWSASSRLRLERRSSGRRGFVTPGEKPAQAENRPAAKASKQIPHPRYVAGRTIVEATRAANRSRGFTRPGRSPSGDVDLRRWLNVEPMKAIDAAAAEHRAARSRQIRLPLADNTQEEVTQAVHLSPLLLIGLIALLIGERCSPIRSYQLLGALR